MGGGIFSKGTLKNREACPRPGSIYAILKIRSVYVSGPKGKNIANGGSAACNPKFDNFGF